ncbi:hypothetical protein CIK97_05905 [Prevotella sp. P3-120]|uniref:DUF2334 domain-containing protein n=1 Tax=unclassified Prevotella TaxID=2638335 RepID=UPI000B971236|nr:MULTISPECIES: DUF2334 domain-containing protein [unclassified Prevotella]OYP50547.1 hypothetical protein CIK97_05905 [Prevotella sp. P3-120]OYP51107.1 hypothetical protein CIK93_06090 [Prevotella sp. P3-92]
MKFILRDDDINYHYSAEQLAKWYDGITDICPVSICIPAFIKGDFFKWVEIFESHTPYDENEWLKTGVPYKLGDNKELVKYIKGLIENGKATISMHGIHHRNEEMDMPPVANNFIRGAEFYTNNDYTSKLKEAKEYLENLFKVKICSFSPPQNMINLNGLRAIRNNHLSLCADLIRSPRMPKTMVEFYGLAGTIKILYYRFALGHQYPYIIHHKGIDLIGHCRLQPGNNYDEIINSFNYCYKKNGVFVLSTHSYGFDTQMADGSGTMKETLMRVLNVVKQYPNIEYTTLNDIFCK